MTIAIPETYSVFEQPWWLNATSQNSWDEVTVEEGGRTVARLPFSIQESFGMRRLTQPPLTQTLGPWIEPSIEGEARKLSREKDLMGRLITKLPRHVLFRQNFNPAVSNWLPFYWAGFKQTTRYTYVLHDLTSSEKIFSDFGSSTRKEIRRAEKSLTVDLVDSLDEIVRMAELSFRRQGRKLPYDAELLYRIDESAKKFGRRIAMVCRDAYGRTHSAAYIVGDERRMYCLVTGSDPQLKSGQSGPLLHWRAIEQASRLTSVFDFEGSMIAGVEEFYRKFGARQIPYLSVSRAQGLIGKAMQVRNLVLE